MDERAGETPITIRFPQDVLRALRRLAKAQQRSFNGEVIWALRDYVRRAAPEGQGRETHEDKDV